MICVSKLMQNISDVNSGLLKLVRIEAVYILRLAIIIKNNLCKIKTKVIHRCHIERIGATVYITALYLTL